MNKLSYIMLCKHDKGTVEKLVIHAVRCQGEHFQGYAIAECCCVCGKRLSGFDYKPTLGSKI